MAKSLRIPFSSPPSHLLKEGPVLKVSWRHESQSEDMSWENLVLTRIRRPWEKGAQDAPLAHAPRSETHSLGLRVWKACTGLFM